MRTPLGFLLLALFGFFGSLPAPAQDSKASDETAEGEEEITLERLFPEKRFFGASARSAAFSDDGRYGTFLWRTWLERRHGYDLWLHDFQTGETRRLTSATVFEPFQRDAKKVAEDRREQAKKAAKKKAKDAESEESGKAEGTGPEEDGAGDGDLGDLVDEDDAEREDAPRWGGVSSYAWSPVADEMLLVSGGDVYRWKVDGEGLERVTHTRDAEGGVQWLEDGSGFLYRQDSALLRVVFGDHRIVQLDPELPSGERLGSFSISPDGKKIAMLATKGDRGFTGGGRTVKIADYGERFMTVREVPRLVSDDPQPDRESVLYVYVLPEGMGEDGEVHRLHRHVHTGPRDQVGTPDWAPDSSRVTFAVFTQAESTVEVFEGVLPEEEEAGASWAELVARAKGDDTAEEGEEKGGDEENKDEEKKDEEGEDESKKPEDEADDSEVHDLPARVVYKFLHQGGPNTPSMVDPHYAADSRHLVFVTEQSGFRHLGRLDPLYESFEPLTSGPFEVYLDFMPDTRDFAIVTSTREDSSCQDVYRVDLATGGMQRLTQNTARYSSVAAAADGGRLLAMRDAYGSLRELVGIDVAAKTEAILTDSHAPEAKELTAATPEFFEFENRHGFQLRGMMFKPEGWKAEDRRPCLIYVYGGPLGTRKEVTQGSYSGSAYLFAWYMAKEHGYVTATIDTRGMSGYGAVFEKANFEQVGKPQVEDLVDGARWLVENAGVDPERVGLHGWSFGGFQTQMCMYTEPEVFACGIAGAGPTEWENYNSWYSTGTIGDSREGTPDLEKYSLLPLAKNLQHKLLLVHGMEDSNVLYQDTVRVYAELLDAGKETLVELFLDPSGGHGLGGYVKSLGRYRKYEEFLLRCLGRSEG